MEEFPGKSWITCNSCCVRASTSTSKFFLTSCAHIYCSRCAEAGKTLDSVSNLPKFTCRHCKKVINLIEISNNMPESAKILFRKPEDLWAEENAEIAKIIRFQNSHFVHLLKHQAKLRSDTEKLKAYYLDISKKKKQLERKLSMLNSRFGTSSSLDECLKKTRNTNPASISAELSSSVSATEGAKLCNTSLDLDRSLLPNFPNFSGTYYPDF